MRDAEAQGGPSLWDVPQSVMEERLLGGQFSTKPGLDQAWALEETRAGDESEMQCQAED